MARTLSVTDDESGITASMRVEEVDGRSLITKLHFDAADGFGIAAEHLRIVQDFGLQLPLPATVAPEVVAPAPAPRKVAPVSERVPSPRKPPAAKQPTKRKRYAGGVPSDAVLQSMYASHNGSARGIAESIGSSTSAVVRWLTEARRRGATFTIDTPNGAVTVTPS